MNQKSSLREVPQLVSWVLTGNNRLRSSMVELGLEGDFDEMRSRAEARFPASDPKEERPAEDRYIAMDWLGMKGVVARSALWAEVAGVGSARLDQFATAVGTKNDIPAREMIEKIALRYVRARKIGLFEFRNWAIFAVCNLFDDEQFEQLVGVADDMGLMSASELVTALNDEPLGARMKRRAESGGAPSVTYQFIPRRRAQGENDGEP